MKKLLTAMLFSAVFAAQAAPSKSAPPADAGFPKSVNALEQAQVRQQNALVAREETRVVAHYDANGKPTEQPTAGGFYRMLLGYTAEGKAVVQDFYQDSRTKQTNPVVIPNSSQLANFDAAVIDGRCVWYTPEGDVREAADIRGGETVRSAMYQDGKLVFATLKHNGAENILMYHLNGVLAVRGVVKSDKDVTLKLYNTKGRQIYDNRAPSKKLAAKDAATVADILTRYNELNGRKQFSGQE